MTDISDILKIFDSFSKKGKGEKEENLELLTFIEKLSKNKVSQKEAKNILSITKEMLETINAKTSQEGAPPPAFFDFSFDEEFEKATGLELSTTLEMGIADPSNGLSVFRIFPIPIRFFALLVILSYAAGAVKYGNPQEPSINIDPEDLQTMYDIITKYMPDEDKEKDKEKEKPYKIAKKRRER